MTSTNTTINPKEQNAPTQSTPPMQARRGFSHNPYTARVSPGPEGINTSPNMHPHVGRDSVSPGLTLGPSSTDQNLTPRTMPATPNPPDQRFVTHVESANSSLAGKPPSPMPHNDSLSHEAAVWAPRTNVMDGATPTYTQQMFAELTLGGHSHNSALANYGSFGSNHQQQQHQQQRYRNPGSTTPPPQPEPGMAAHTYLMNKLRYVPLPATMFFAQPSPHHRQAQQQHMAERHVEMYRGRGEQLVNTVPCTDLFVAQLPFNMDLQALQFLADALDCPIDIVHAAPHYKGGRSYDGCAFVKVPSDRAEMFLTMFHKGALFDSQGVWVAETAEQRHMLAAYCNWMQCKSPHERRQILGRPIPFSAMTAEVAKRSYVF